MGKFIIEGGHRLSGRVKVQGAKNAALPPIPIADFLPEDVVITRGTQDYATAKA